MFDKQLPPFRVEKALHDELRLLAKDQGRRISDLLRDLLRQAVTRERTRVQRMKAAKDGQAPARAEDR